MILIDYLEKDYIVNGINLGKADVIEYNFSEDDYCIFRPSGTEPKLKCHIGTSGETQEESDNKTKNIKDAVNALYDVILK